jgi:hypothetical protein
MSDSENDKTHAGSPQEDRPATQPGRKPYKSPELVEYGSVAKLTQGTLSMNADFCGGGFRMDQMCL